MVGLRKIWLATVVCFITLAFGARSVQAKETTGQSPNSYLIINQVRGHECCSEGSVSALQQQINTTVTNQLQAYFALRYDALQDPAFYSVIQTSNRRTPTQIKPALLLEITPALAEAAGVEYGGDVASWYETNQAYTLGYEPSDRRKIIDRLMESYRAVFNDYPDLTSGWMLDTDTLNYVVDRYGVQAHQITREQWGVDSYTLQGGPIHYPYPASREWLFAPDYQATNSAMIVRQTISDPVWNYGDSTSAFTSQPNDYAIDGKDINYFQQLADQTFNNSNTVGFMVLGLENSMSDFFQNDYQRQLEWLGDQVENHRTVAADVNSIEYDFRTQRPLVFWGKDLTDPENSVEAWWITTGAYRARLLRQGDTFAITDLRVYNPQFEDPYNTRIARRNGYWIMPFLVESSLSRSTPAPRSWWQRLLFPPSVLSGQLQPVSDVTSAATNVITMPAVRDDGMITTATNDADSSVVFTYPSVNGEVQIVFNNDTIHFQGVEKNQALHGLVSSQNPPITVRLQENNQQIAATLNDDVVYSATVDDSSDDGFSMSFASNADQWPDFLDHNPYYFYPELQLINNPDPNESVYYVNNRYAMAGRNPVRLVLAPKNAEGVPVGLSVTPRIDVAGAELMTALSDQQEQDLQFFDFENTEPGVADITIGIGDSITWKERVYFAPDCRAQWQLCVSNPQYAYWYGRVKLWDWLLREK